MLRKLFFVITVLALAACANTQPVYNAESNPFPQNLSQEEAQRAIVNALNYKRWSVVEKSDDTIVAEIYVRSHYAKIAIPYSQEGYSVRYLDSNNLDYQAGENKIHRNYNRWITMLQNEINRSASMIAASN